MKILLSRDGRRVVSVPDPSVDCFQYRMCYTGSDTRAGWGLGTRLGAETVGPTTYHSRPVGASASTEQNTSIRACPSGLLARKSRPYADAPISREIDIKKLYDVIKDLLT